MLQIPDVLQAWSVPLWAAWNLGRLLFTGMLVGLFAIMAAAWVTLMRLRKRHTDLSSDLEFVKALAKEAAGVAMKRRRSVTPHEKDNLTYVTDLDQDLERLIRGRLGARFPDDALTG